jgi:Putative lumazine-binding
MSEDIEAYDAIAKVIHIYIEGAKKGDVGLLREAFHPKARLFGAMKDGTRYDLNMKKFFKDSAEMPLNSHGGHYRARLLSVERFGPSAVAVLAEDGCWGAVSFVDIFSLNQIGGTWKIVNKTFTHTSGAPPAS